MTKNIERSFLGYRTVFLFINSTYESIVKIIALIYGQQYDLDNVRWLRWADSVFVRCVSTEELSECYGENVSHSSTYKFALKYVLIY